jgi:2'-5' RNA ligase
VEFDQPIRFHADSVNLYQSRPTPAGSRYEVLHAVG